MKILILAVTAALVSAAPVSADTAVTRPLSATPAAGSQTTSTPGASSAAPAQTPAVAVPFGLDIPDLPTTVEDPTCGGRANVAQQAFCIRTTQAAMQEIADQYDAAFQKQGWLAAGGEDNRTIYVKRRDGGGCLGFQLLAFADESRPAAPAAPGYFAFAAIPGDVCAARSDAPAPAQ